jgi:hypothetical protein
LANDQVFGRTCVCGRNLVVVLQIDDGLWIMKRSEKEIGLAIAINLVLAAIVLGIYGFCRYTFFK